MAVSGPTGTRDTLREHSHVPRNLCQPWDMAKCCLELLLVQPSFLLKCLVPATRMGDLNGFWPLILTLALAAAGS